MARRNNENNPIAKRYQGRNACQPSTDGMSVRNSENSVRRCVAVLPHERLVRSHSLPAASSCQQLRAAEEHGQGAKATHRSEASWALLRKAKTRKENPMCFASCSVCSTYPVDVLFGFLRQTHHPLIERLHQKTRCLDAYRCAPFCQIRKLCQQVAGTRKPSARTPAGHSRTQEPGNQAGGAGTQAVPSDS